MIGRSSPDPGRKPGFRGAWFLAFLAVLASTACGGSRAPAPVAGDTRGFVPDLTGSRVIVLPVQQVAGMPGQADAELAFALESRAPQVMWILPPELERAARSTPGMEMPIRRLPVGIFLQAEVDRIGDPLYGVLRRLAAVTDAEMALIPVVVRYRPPAPDSTAAGQDTVMRERRDTVEGTAEVAVALVSILTGHVVWFGVVSGSAGSPDDPRVLASALDALGRRLAPAGFRD